MLIVILMNFRGLLYILLCFQATAQEPVPEVEPNVFAEVATLAKTDTTAAVNLLRQSENLDPERLFEAFDDLDPTAHFSLLHEICKDQALANRFVFDSSSLIPEIWVSHERPAMTLERIIEEMEHNAPRFIVDVKITPLLKAAPVDMPTILAVPALEDLFGTNFLIQVMTGPRDSDLSKEQKMNLILKEVNAESVPERFHEVLKLAMVSHDAEAYDLEKIQTSNARIAELLNDENLPLSVRLGISNHRSSISDIRKGISDDSIILTAGWLASALEQEIPWCRSETPKLLQQFYETQSHPDWKKTATRILDSSGTINSWGSKNAPWTTKSHPWLVGIAAALGDRDQIQNLKANTVKTSRTLANDPSFFLLVREGFFDLANQEIKEKNRQLLLTQGLGFLRDIFDFQEVLFDDKLESSTREFIKTIPNADVKFITELHLKLLPDHPGFPPQINHAERSRALARRLENMEFKEPAAKYTALRMIGKFPKAAGEIADTYIAYSQFDRIDKNLNDIFRDEAWIEIAIDTLKAVLNAKRYDDADMILRKIAESTARLDGDFYRRAHNELWGEIATVFTELIGAENSSAQLLPLARFLNSLTRKHFSPADNYLLGGLFKTTVARHSEHAQMTQWWIWYEKLPPTVRKNHDLILTSHILGKNRIYSGSHSWDDDPTLKPTPEIKPYLELVRTFRDVPHDHPAEARIAAAIRGCRPVTPASIAIFYDYRYLSAEEILENADELAAALPEENFRKWDDLARVAREAGKENLAEEFSKKARQTPK